MSNLAILGEKPIRTKLFPDQNTMGDEEKQAVLEVMDKGRLSGYRANWCDEFMGGQSVRKLEDEWQKRFNVKHAIAVNSCTSGLQVACGAVGLQPKDEVIVSPYSMTCSSTAPLIYNAVPIFADIEKKYYCLDPEDIIKKITPKTKAIIAVSLFGIPYDIQINHIAREYGLTIIEDAAQAVGSTCKFMNNIFYAGTLGDIGVFSFNYGKHLNCGEGGMLVTNDDNLAFRCQLIRNHAEAVISGIEYNKNPDGGLYAYPVYNMVGFNMRLTELQASIISEQLKKLDQFIQIRRENVEVLHNVLKQIPAISVSPIRENTTHVYYVDSYIWDSKKANNIHRNVFINAVKAELTEREGREGEGVPIGSGYIRPLYTMPLFKQRKLYKDKGNYPFNDRIYPKGLCPVCEDLSFNKLFLTLLHAPNSTKEDMADVADAFEKVWHYRNELIRR